MQKEDLQAFIMAHIVEDSTSHRGGVLKVDVSELFPEVENAIMGAYQNYLGGGMLGAIVGASMFQPDELSEEQKTLFFELKDEIKRYFHSITNHEDDEWEAQTYEQNQKMPVSAY